MNCWWGHACCPQTGRTQGSECGYCMNIWSSLQRHRVLPDGTKNTLKVWSASLGSEEGALEKHILKVDILTQHIVRNGGKRTIHPNWEEVEAEVLKLVRIKELRIKQPNRLHYSWAQYEDAFPGGIEKHRKEGHREFTLLGVDGAHYH